MLREVPEDYLKEARSAWNLLCPPEERDGHLEYTVTDSSVACLGTPIQYAVDSTGMRHVLVPYGDRRAPRHDHTCDGVWIDATHLEAGDNEWRLDVSYHWRRNPELFSLFCANLLWGLAAAPVDPVETVFEALGRWKSLFSHATVGTLDRQTAIGLFGELWFLEALTQIRRDAVEYWTGPEGQQHDFRFPSGALEVKTSTARENHLVWVSSLDQLDADRPLALAFLQVEAGAGEALTLSELAQRILQATSGPARFAEMLASYGVSADSLLGATDLKFTVRNSTLYLVDDEFPRLTMDSLVRGVLPEGVRAVKYQVDIDLAPRSSILPPDWLETGLAR